MLCTSQPCDLIISHRWVILWLKVGAWATCLATRHLRSVMVTKPKSRTTFDRSVTVSDLQGAVVAAQRRAGTRDLLSWCKTLELEETWKTAPKLQLLVRHLDVMEPFLELHPNTVISHDRLKLALLAENQHAKMFTSFRPSEQCAAVLSNILRIHASKWREVARLHTTRSFILAKAAHKIHQRSSFVVHQFIAHLLLASREGHRACGWSVSARHIVDIG